MLFDWDDANRQHIARHRITPEEEEEIFQGIYFDLEMAHVNDEERFSVIGETKRERTLIVWCTWRGDSLRVVTAWDAPKAEKALYLQARGTDYEF